VNAEQSVQRLLEDESEQFVTKQVDVEDFTPPEGSSTNVSRTSWIDTDNLKCEIVWTLDVNYSSWGINDLRPRIQKIYCSWTENTYDANGDDGDTLRRSFTWTHKIGKPDKADATFDVDAALAGRAANLSFPLDVRAIFYDRNRYSERDYLTVAPMGIDLDLQEKTAVVRF